MVSEQEPNSFRIVEKQVQSYLEDPTSGDPYDSVNRYFGASELGKQTADEAQQLLFDTRSKILTPRPFDLDPRFGNPGTITMRLPYFYPLHITLFGWYVEGRVSAAQDFNPEEKESLARRLREDAVIYCLTTDEITRVDRRLSSLRPSLDVSSMPAPVQQPSLPWYKRLNLFKR